ncbi:MAG: efflux RND transporter permease subunit [Desulfosalsimonas sp.]|uniref:efflux RND transporter permease subunit n=1 Tax=Desulfosalsimonas sp. TaxID=3073848 RepID=UPI003970A23D
MVRNPIAANLLMIILIVGGIWTAFAIQKEVFPEFELDMVEVYVSYPGADPAEVEQGILLPVEEAIRGVEGIEAEMRESTAALRGGFIMAMAVIYGLLAVIFASYIQPLIVMTAIPFGIVGAVAGHILLTTLTTFGGLTPIILETSRQAAYLIPMAISLGFGIVPCLYLVVEDLAGPGG